MSDDDVEKTFERIAMGAWIEDEYDSVSGPGSTLPYTKNLRQALEKFLKLCGAKSLLDAPCGDFNWMRHVNLLKGLRYFGADIVSDLVKANIEKYSDGDRLFFKSNIIFDPLPDADVLLCRDCLFHLSFKHALAALNNGARSNFRYYMITSHYNETNTDIETGGFRQLNLEKAPFLFPKPVATIRDFVEGWPARQIGIWTRDQVIGALISG